MYEIGPGNYNGTTINSYQALTYNIYYIPGPGKNT